MQAATGEVADETSPQARQEFPSQGWTGKRTWCGADRKKKKGEEKLVSSRASELHGEALAPYSWYPTVVRLEYLDIPNIFVGSSVYSRATDIRVLSQNPFSRFTIGLLQKRLMRLNVIM